MGDCLEEIEEEATKRGMEEGIQEAERNFAKKLLSRNYSDEEISELTGLELKEVTELQRTLEN